MKTVIKKWFCIMLILGLLCALFSFGAAAGMRGDVDGDGALHASDARLALRRSVKLENYLPGSTPFIAADMDGDGAVSAGDARSVLRLSVGLEQAEDIISELDEALAKI